MPDWYRTAYKTQCLYLELYITTITYIPRENGKTMKTVD